MEGALVEKTVNWVCLFVAGNRNFRFPTVLKAPTTGSQLESLCSGHFWPV